MSFLSFFCLSKTENGSMSCVPTAQQNKSLAFIENARLSSLSEDYRKDVLAILADGFELLQNIYISKVNYVLLSTKLFSHFLHIIDIDCYSFNQITCFFFRYGT